MVTIGVDAHKAVHQALALHDAGTILGSWRGATTPDACQHLLAWAETFPGPRQFGIEGAWNYGRGLAQFLIGRGESVVEVNPRWTAERRRRARKSGKSDRLDAHAVATLVREEGSSLPRVAAEDEIAVLDLLVTEREAMLAESTRLRNQLHQLLLQVDPDYKSHLPSLTSAAGLQAVTTYTVATALPLQKQRVAAIQRLAQRLELATEQAAALEQEICAWAKAHDLPLTQVKGVGLYTAGALAGMAGTVPSGEREGGTSSVVIVKRATTASDGISAVRHAVADGIVLQSKDALTAPVVPSTVPYAVLRRGNKPWEACGQSIPQSTDWRRGREARVSLAATAGAGRGSMLWSTQVNVP